MLRMRIVRVSSLTVIALATSMAITAVTACSDEATPVTGPGSTDAQTTEDGSTTDDSSAPKDSGSPKDGSSSSGDAKADTGPVGDAITISDGAARFTTRSFTDYTCPNLPGLGNVLQWVIPEDIRAAVNLPAGSTYHFRVESAAEKNVVIAGPPADKKYFVGDQAIGVTTSGTLPSTTMMGSPPASGTITVSGKWTCP